MQHKSVEIKSFKNGRHKMYFGGVLVGKIKHENMHKPCAYIADLYIKEKYQNRQFGTSLLNYVIGIAIENGCEAVKLHVLEDNVDAIRLYRREGFFIYASKIKNSQKRNHHLMVKRIDNLQILRTHKNK
jgi:ribosomal protein S18 acetylase RimI-like enzyme